MKKVILYLLLIIGLFIFVGCDFDFLPDENEEHTHEYPSTWEYDSEYHYKKCISDECESYLQEKHTFNENDICEKCGYDKNNSQATIYTVTFVDNFDKVLSVQKIEKGKDATPPTIDSGEEYTFLGWDKSYKNIQSDITIKALVEEIIEDKDEYNISFDLNGGSWDYSSKEEFTIAFLSDFYDFVAPDCDLETFIYDSNKAFKGKWSDYIGGKYSDTNKLLLDNNIDLDDSGYFFNSPVYKAKWYCLSYFVKNSICGINKRFGESNYYYGSLDFYRYITNDPSIYIDYYGGEETFYSYPKQNTDIIETYKKGEETELPTPVSRLFDYWVNSKGEKITKISKDTKGDLTLKAVWKESETYTIDFDSDGGNNIDTINVTYGQTFDLPTPVKEGYIFIGWYYNDSLFNSNLYSFHINLNLKAHWRDSSKVELENLVYDGSNVTYRNSTTVVQIPNAYVQPETQLRACWVSSFAGDFSPSTNKETMQKNLTEVLDIMEAFNMNCIIFHIRTHNQAFYKTDLTYIDSKYGTYSSFEEWDYLTWFISECHKRGIEFHAWLNPYRIVSEGATSLADVAAKWADYPNNPASKTENLLMNSSGGVIMNPGIEEVRDYIVDICLDIMQHYDVDAIHFDDYFYISGIDDAETMKANNPKSLSVDNWRRSQVNLFIESLSEAMREYNIRNNKHVQLGISPTGIYKNGDGSLNSGSNTSGYAHYGSPLYADTYYWIKEGWIDYIMPQIYWSFTLKAAGFAAVCDWWNMAVEGTGVNFYAGMGLYMSMTAGKNAAWGSQAYEASNQILYTTKLENCQGVSFYKWASLKSAYQDATKVSHDGVLRIKNEYWTSKVATPSTMSTNYNYKNVTK